MTDRLLHFVLVMCGVGVGTFVKATVERLVNEACPRCSFRKFRTTRRITAS